MKTKESHIQGLIEIFPDIWKDERGHFFESFHINKFKDIGINEAFLQDNQSYSIKGVVRGLHFQNKPYEQGKLVRVITGKALDVVVDIRKESPTYGQIAKFVLDSNIGNMLYVPPGFAHGFAALEDCIFCYKCTDVYNKESESGILWNDPQLNIDWEVTVPLVSDKDKMLPTFEVIHNKINA